MSQALIVIDAQQDLIEGNDQEAQVWEKERLIANINTVIEKALSKEILIVFIRDEDVGGGKGPGFDVHENIHVPPSAETFNKLSTNAFHKTPLLAHLQKHQVNHVVIMGCATQHCIDTAVRAATTHSLDVTLIGDGHSTADSPVLSAETIIAHHNATLHGHYNVDHFCMVRHADENVFEPQHHEHR
ncbi:isochorismatase family protein [Aureibacillus halotolerans]|uniref:Nicotinamidase-related amidase n=1 Tax=Aureibacillus halotolerans TaxID=1508390 RepID=A0A4R6TVC8_9BACI|nr:isochorismatase family protein [Aureibacillus halotolerans]TDQ37738.1 nicotinamidase-related amidase [Aureibacillus halotolerans]